MECHECGGNTTVIDTRQYKKLTSITIRRRRVCMSCGLRFNTVEKLMPEKKKKTSDIDKFFKKKYKKEPDIPEPVVPYGFIKRADRYNAMENHHVSVT